MPALDALAWTQADEDAIRDDEQWMGLPYNLGWPEESLTEEKVFAWRRMFRETAKAHRLRAPPTRRTKTREELNQQLAYLDGFPEAQRDAIERFEEDQRKDSWLTKEVPDAKPAGISAQAFVESMGAMTSLARLEAMTEVAEQALERMRVFKELDAELELEAGATPNIEGAPNVNSLIADWEATIEVLRETRIAMEAQTEGN